MILMVPAHIPSTSKYPQGSFVSLGNLCSYFYPLQRAGKCNSRCTFYKKLHRLLLSKSRFPVKFWHPSVEFGCPLPTAPPTPTFIFISPLFLFFFGLTARERCEMIHVDSWWHIISVLIRPYFF